MPSGDGSSRVSPPQQQQQQQQQSQSQSQPPAQSKTSPSSSAAASAANQMSFRRYERHEPPTALRRCTFLTRLVFLGNERHAHARYVHVLYYSILQVA